MFLKWSTSLSILLKNQHSIIGALFVFITQVSLSHLNEWFMSYLILYGGSLELLFWQLFLFSFHFFFLLGFWVFNNLFFNTNHRTCLHFLFLHAVFMYQSSVQPPLHHVLLCPFHPLQILPFPPLGLSPWGGIMLTCPSTEPFLVIAFSTQHSSHTSTGAHNVFCQDVSASTSWVTASGQFL